MALRIAVALVVMVFATPVHAQEAAKWKQDLLAEGWVEVKRKLTDFTDYTWYGQANKYRSTKGYVYYLTPSGKTGRLRTPSGRTFVDYRTEGTDGKICSLVRELRGGRRLCGNTLWKRGELYLFTNPAGRVIHVWKWKKGNLEGFALD